MKKQARRTEKSLLTPSQFGDKKGVSRATVHRHLNDGLIKITYVGMCKDIYIDWEDYKDYEFKESMKRTNS